MEHITSRANPLLVHMKKLSADGAYRRERGEYLCDSPKLLEEALRWGAEVTAVVSTSGAQAPHARCVTVPEDVMASVSPMRSPQGVVFACRLPRTAPPAALEGGRYVALDGVQDPGNVGTVLRTLDAFDGDGLLLLPGCADPFAPKTVRASMGAVFRRSVWQVTAQQLAALARGSGLPLCGAALDAHTADVSDAPLDRCIMAIGSEGRGLSPQVLALCDMTVRIPMSPRCESLNAAVAAAVLLWEGWRQTGP